MKSLIDNQIQTKELKRNDLSAGECLIKVGGRVAEEPERLEEVGDVGDRAQKFAGEWRPCKVYLKDLNIFSDERTMYLPS